MKIIKNSKELKKLVNEFNDLILDEDVRIEFEPTREELRDVKCYDLYLENDKKRFDFNGWNFNGENFNGMDFNGEEFNGFDFNGNNFNGYNFKGRNFNGENFDGDDFNGRNFNGKNFKGWNFNGENFNGRKISYYAFFNCYGSIKCTSWEKRRDNAQDPVCLDGKLEIISEEDEDVLEAIKLLKEKGKLKNGKILIK